MWWTNLGRIPNLANIFQGVETTTESLVNVSLLLPWLPRQGHWASTLESPKSLKSLNPLSYLSNPGNCMISCSWQAQYAWNFINTHIFFAGIDLLITCWKGQEMIGLLAMSLFDFGPVVSGYVSMIMDTWLQLASPTPDLWQPRHWCPEFLRPARTQRCLKFHGFASPKMPQFLGWFWWTNLTTTMLRLGRAAFGCLWYKGCFNCLVVRTHLLHISCTLTHWYPWPMALNGWPEAMSFYEGLGFTPTAATVSLILILYHPLSFCQNTFKQRESNAEIFVH